MNEPQRMILKCALAAVVIITAFPPFVAPAGAGVMRGEGFGFLLSWPDRAMVHVELLVAEWLAVGILSAILWALRADTKTPRKE